MTPLCSANVPSLPANHQLAMFSAALLGALLLAVPVVDAGAQQIATATICELKEGPRAGERNRLRGAEALLEIGSPCSDGRGSTGVVVAKDATSGLYSPPDSTRKHASCFFERGTRAGQILRGVLPAPLGSQCHDRNGNYGVIVEDVPESKKAHPALGGIPTSECRPSPTRVRPPVCRVSPGVPTTVGRP